MEFIENKLKYWAMALLAISMVACMEEEETEDEFLSVTVEADFTFEVDNNTGVVKFTNASSEAVDYKWDFGDGTESTETNPEKTYTQDGDYDVVLTATNGEASDTQEKTVTIELTVPVIVDDEAPVIALNGDAMVTIAIGEAYNETATASDNVDMDITDQIVIDGEVNTLQPGEYTLTYNVSDAAGNAAIEVTRTVTVTFDDGLITNGDFEAAVGDNDWFVNFGNPPVVPIQEDGGNNYIFVNITSPNSEQPFLVNLSQVIPMNGGDKYKLSFNASTGEGQNRTILAGIGLNELPFTNTTEAVSLTSTQTRYELELTANFESANSRVLFDMNGEAGVVVIDNVSLELIEAGNNGGGGGGATGGGCNDVFVAASALPLDFEGCESFVSSFNNDGSISVANADNPSMTGNASAYVLKVDKANGTNRWAGFQNSFSSNLDFTSDVLKMKIYSTKANTTFRFELKRDPQTDPVTPEPGVAFIEVANANEWTEVEVEFPGFVGDKNLFNMIVIKPDNPNGSDGELTTSDETYYFDDMQMGPKSDNNGGGGDPVSYCSTEIAGNTPPAGSEILMTAEYISATRVRIEVQSADANPVTGLVIPAGAWSTVPGFDAEWATPQEVSSGVFASEFFFGGGAPASLDFNILWNKTDVFAGNWDSGTLTLDAGASCE